MNYVVNKYMFIFKTVNREHKFLANIFPIGNLIENQNSRLKIKILNSRT